MFPLLQAADAAAQTATDAAAATGDAAAAATAAAGDVAATAVDAAAPVAEASAAEIAAAAAAAQEAAGVQQMTLVDMVMAAPLLSKIVLVLLVLMAIYSLAMLFEKVIVMRGTNKKVKDFLAQFLKAKTPDEAAQLVAKQPDSTIKKMFAAGWAEVQKTRELGIYSMQSGDHTLGRVDTAMSIEQNKGIEDISSSMTALASIGANAPFIGLFGTVFGIINSFIGIVNSQSTSLVVVAPGIAEALVATGAGLLAAIPAVLIYNYSAKQIGKVGGYMDDFKAQFLSLVSRDMDSQG
jgi:biopolymer transport protein ExbB